MLSAAPGRIDLGIDVPPAPTAEQHMHRRSWEVLREDTFPGNWTAGFFGHDLPEDHEFSG